MCREIGDRFIVKDIENGEKRLVLRRAEKLESIEKGELKKAKEYQPL